MMLFKWLLAALLMFGALVAVMYVAQRSMMYFPETLRTPPAAAGLPAAEEIVLATADGEKVIVWHVPPRDGSPVVLYLHGNGGSLRYRIDRFRAITADGNGLIALSYRGYGGSTGSPSEQGLIADATAAYDFAVARYPAERIVLWGESLGTGVAIALAAERKVARVVLEAPFTSAADVGAAVYWFLPVRLLMKDQFRSDQRIARVTAPVLILHGEADGIIPIQYGERLFAMTPGEKRLVRFPRGSHNDLDDYGASDEALKFLQQSLN